MLEHVEGRYLNAVASRGCYERQLCAKPAEGGLEVENVAHTPMQDRTGKEGGEQGSAVVSISCFSAICGSKGTISLSLLLWNLF